MLPFSFCLIYLVSFGGKKKKIRSKVLSIAGCCPLLADFPFDLFGVQTVPRLHLHTPFCSLPGLALSVSTAD